MLAAEETGGREEGPGQQHAGPAQVHALVGPVGKLTMVAESPAPRRPAAGAAWAASHTPHTFPVLTGGVMSPRTAFNIAAS